MAIKTDNLVLYHIPKCGGIWAKEALRRSLYDRTVYGRCPNSAVRNSFGLYREHATPDGTLDTEKDNKLLTCFVRHPVTWYQSFWAFRMKTESYDKNFPLDDLMDDDINSFIANVYEQFPTNFITPMFQCYVGDDLMKVNFIGKQETLADDLIEVMTLAGEDFDPDKIRSLKFINIAASSKKFRDQVKINPDVENKILEKEDWVIQTFYKNNV